MHPKPDPYATPVQRRINVLLVAFTIVVLLILFRTSAHAADRDWTGGNSTDFEEGGNWQGSAPKNDLNSDRAVFTGTPPARQPMLTMSRSINGLVFNTGGWTLSGSAFTLSLGNSGINASGTNTISANLALGANQTWSVGSGGTLNITGALTNAAASRTLTLSNAGVINLSTVNLSNDATSRLLTITGTGSVTFGGVIQNGGGSPGSNLTFNGSYSGTATINGTNTYSGTTTLTGGNTGTFVLGNKSAFGTSGLIFNSGTIQASTDLSGANAITNAVSVTSTVGTNTISGSNNIEFSGAWSHTVTKALTNNLSSGALLTLSGGVSIGGGSAATLTIDGTGNTLINSVVSNGGAAASNLAKAGSGTLTLSGASPNTFTGTTTINGGILALAKAGALGGTSGITVNSGGTLLLSGSTSVTDRIRDGAGVTIAGGGTFNTGGLSEGIRPSTPTSSDGVAGMGALTLTGTSASARAIIDFATGANGSSLVFSSLSGGANAFVNILNWTGLAGTDTGSPGNDRLLFAANPNLTNAQLANWSFFNDAGTAFATGGTIIQYGNMWELVAVPEPSTYLAGALALAAVGFTQRRRLLGRNATPVA